MIHLSGRWRLEGHRLATVGFGIDRGRHLGLWLDRCADRLLGWFWFLPPLLLPSRWLLRRFGFGLKISLEISEGAEWFATLPHFL